LSAPALSPQAAARCDCVKHSPLSNVEILNFWNYVQCVYIFFKLPLLKIGSSIAFTYNALSRPPARLFRDRCEALSYQQQVIGSLELGPQISCISIDPCFPCLLPFCSTNFLFAWVVSGLRLKCPEVPASGDFAYVTFGRQQRVLRTTYPITALRKAIDEYFINTK